MSPPSSNKQTSFSYTKRITEAQLEQGLTLPILTPGAVLRITALQDKTLPSFTLKTPMASFQKLEECSSLYSSDEALAESLPTDLHQTIVQIKPELGRGTFVLKTKEKGLSANNTYVVSVFEKHSSIQLEIDPSSLHYKYGDEFKALISLKEKERTYPISYINAVLISPKNQMFPLTLKKLQEDQFEASTLLNFEEETHGGNWYIEVAVASHNVILPVYRTGKAAFSYSIPSASLSNIQKISSNPLILRAQIHTATASRYSLQGLLLHQDNKGALIPFETAQSTQWLEPGEHTIELHFENPDQIEEDKIFFGPLYILDYGQLKKVYEYNAPIKLSHLAD
jgi:hypothetical protein